MEKDFQSEIKRSIDVAGGHYYKIADMPYALAKQANYKERKPYDCYWLYGGAFHAMELKQNKSLSFPFSSIRDHQEHFLLEVEEQGGYGWVVVNFRVRLTEKQEKKYGDKIIDRAYGARISDLVEQRVSQARNSLPLDWWEKSSVRIDKLSSSPISWDIKSLHERRNYESQE